MTNSLSTNERSDYLKLQQRIKKWVYDDRFQAGFDLLAIRDRKLYREDFDTFEEFCEQKFEIKRAQAYRLIEASEVKMSPIGRQIENERQAREIAKVPEAERERVLNSASKNGSLTASKIKSASEAIKDPIQLDATGYKITKTGLAVWERSSEVKQLLTFLSKVKSVIKSAQEVDDVLYRGVVYNSLISHLSNAIGSLKCAVPYAVCTSCQGNNSDKCTLCHGMGMISEFAFNSFTPDEVKSIRSKALSKK